MTRPPDPFDELAAQADSHPVQARPLPTVDLVKVAAAGIEAPELLCDGLLYRGQLHSLAGPPDCGKSTLAYHAALELLRAGQRVVLLDQEGGRDVVVEKLLALDAVPGELELLDYVEFPSRRWDQADQAGLAELLDAGPAPALVIADSAGALLGAAGRDENSAGDVGPLYRLLLEVSRRWMAAVLVLDHLAKVETASRYARGSSMKLQMVDVALMLEAVRPFSRHQDGLLRLVVAKDRRGHLHRRHEISVTTGAGRLDLELREVDGGHGQDPVTAGYRPATRKVLAALRAATEPSTSAQLGDWIAGQHPPGLRRETISKALGELCQDGLATVGPAQPYGAKTWTVVAE